MKQSFKTSSNLKRIDVISLQVKRHEPFMVEEGPITDKTKAIRVMSAQIGNCDKEHFAVLCLDVKGTPTAYSIVHIGTLNQAVIHPREIFKIAILANAHAIILAHNHPSGNLNPSAQDKKITQNLVKAGRLMDIEVHDHVIVSGDDGISLRETENDLFT